MDWLVIKQGLVGNGDLTGHDENVFWSIGDYSESETRGKRSPQERDHNEHLANDGNHLWNLGDYHESETKKKRSPEERDPSEHLANDGNHLWNLGDYHESK